MPFAEQQRATQASSKEDWFELPVSAEVKALPQGNLTYRFKSASQ